MLHSHLSAAGYVVTERDERVLTGAPQLIVTPNYWKPRAQDWRQWRLSPAQRINRMWGMEAVSKKDRLVQTLERRYGVGLCPLMPASFRWRELARRHDWRSVVSNASHWMLKTTAHRGQGLRLVSSEDVLRAEGDAAPHAPRRDAAPDTALAHMLRQPDAVLQRYVSSPLLVNRRKLSLRLYSLVTCAAPLRVYLYREGFALFASDPCAAACSPTMSMAMLRVHAHVPCPCPCPCPCAFPCRIHVGKATASCLRGLQTHCSSRPRAGTTPTLPTVTPSSPTPSSTARAPPPRPAPPPPPLAPRATVRPPSAQAWRCRRRCSGGASRSSRPS